MPPDRYIRICRNPHEPFFWDAATPDEPCPGQGCEDGPHDTYVRYQDAEEGERVWTVWVCKCGSLKTYDDGHRHYVTNGTERIEGSDYGPEKLTVTPAPRKDTP